MDCFKIDENKGLVRYLNVLPSKKSVDIYVNNKLLYADIKYKDFTPYVYMDNKSYKIDVNEAGTKNVLIKTTFILPDQDLFTLAITGNVSQESIIIVDEDLYQKVSKTQAVQRFVNLSPNLPIADIFYNSKPVVDDIDYRDQTLYDYLNPGQYLVSVKENLSGNNIVSSNITFKASRIYSIYIIGNPPNVELLQSVDGNTYAC